RDGEEVLEQLALGGFAEAVELERVLADVQVGVERDLSPGLRHPRRRRRDGQRVPHAADVEHDAVAGGRARDRRPTQARDHPAAFKSGGASAWQIATASASAAWWGCGTCFRPRIALTIRCTWPFSARP